MKAEFSITFNFGGELIEALRRNFKEVYGRDITDEEILTHLNKKIDMGVSLCGGYTKVRKSALIK